MSTATHAAPPARDRYIDSLRVLALVRVVTYHTFGWVWLPVVFPSMGVMFALAGSLVAASLDRRPGQHWAVLRKRARRLLPPLWVYGLVLVPLMLALGWTAGERGGTELSWRTLVFWVLPLSDPPGSDRGAGWVLPLWYIRCYLWLLVLSPAALWCFRHWPRRTFALPLVVLVLYSGGVVALFDRAGEIVLDLSMFGACWLLGFAHHDGLVRRIPVRTVLALSATSCAVGLAWALRYPNPVSGPNIDDIPLADGFYSVGAVLLLLRLYPDFSWLARHRVLDGIVSMVNARAMTVYLWGNLAITGSILLVHRVPALRRTLGDPRWDDLSVYLGAWVLIGVAVLAVGWVEDVAAGRRPRLVPWPRRAQTDRTARRPLVLRPALGGGVLVGGVLVAAGLAALLATPARPSGPRPAPVEAAPSPRPTATALPVPPPAAEPHRRVATTASARSAAGATARTAASSRPGAPASRSGLPVVRGVVTASSARPARPGTTAPRVPAAQPVGLRPAGVWALPHGAGATAVVTGRDDVPVVPAAEASPAGGATAPAPAPTRTAPVPSPVPTPRGPAPTAPGAAAPPVPRPGAGVPTTDGGATPAHRVARPDRPVPRRRDPVPPRGPEVVGPPDAPVPTGAPAPDGGSSPGQG